MAKRHVRWLCAAAIHSVVRLSAQDPPPMKVLPLAMERWTISYRISPVGTVEKQERYYRRSDGAMCVRLLALIDNGAGETLTRRLEFPDGREVYVNDEARIRMTFKRNEPNQAAFLQRIQDASASSKDCGQPSESRLADTAVAGYMTQTWSREQGVGNDGMRFTMHRALALGCVELQVERERRMTEGAYRKDWETIVRSVVIADPSEADCDPGVGYREVPPSEFERLTVRRIAEMEELIVKGWCDTYDCTSADLYHQRMAERDADYRRRQ